MRALQQTTLNGPEDLHLTEVPTPTPGPGELLIRVTAAGLNYVDISQSRGTFRGGPQPPYVAGIEAAGEIVALGDGVGGPAIGTHVVGATIQGGAFAEYAVLPAQAAIPIPPGWTDAQTLGLAVSWPTALAALKPLGALQPGQTVLIHAAAGATGQTAVRLAKHYGATVIAVASAEKHEVLRTLAPDHILDSRSPTLADDILRLTNNTGVDLALESTGGPTFESTLRATKRITGRVIVSGLPAGPASITNWDLVYTHQLHLIGLNLGALIRHTPQIFAELMTELFTLITTGVLTPTNPTTYDLADGPKALTALESRTTTGKLALLP
ncbi:NADPH:quinone oxidoreductase family protein [Kribbella sp. NPDC026611]|uniref:NADPH:quinone oxidoreductase family protein n=1 Tax=Kribbella sp. NPDC026611 TaxID=3154911 RepID=UPI0033C9FA04